MVGGVFRGEVEFTAVLYGREEEALSLLGKVEGKLVETHTH